MMRRMEPDQCVHLGDGAYLHFDGYGFELRANHHENPSDRVYLEPPVARLMVELITDTTAAPPPTEDDNEPDLEVSDKEGATEDPSPREADDSLDDSGDA